MESSVTPHFFRLLKQYNVLIFVKNQMSRKNELRQKLEVVIKDVSCRFCQNFPMSLSFIVKWHLVIGFLARFAKIHVIDIFWAIYWYWLVDDIAFKPTNYMIQFISYFSLASSASSVSSYSWLVQVVHSKCKSVRHVFKQLVRSHSLKRLDQSDFR